MMRSAILGLVVGASTAFATTQGFNYGAVKIDGTVMLQADFQSEFSTAKSLNGTKGAFSSARLYTTIQSGTTSSPISAIPAAIAEDTTLLLGMWASSGQTTIDNEIAALKSAIKTYGSKFTSLVVGLSVGSEDLYRITPTGLANDPSSVGAGPDELVSYIQQVRAAVKGTDLEDMKIGHVDTWTAWVNGSNSAVVDAIDWLGMNTFPYWQTTDPNGIQNDYSLFEAALDSTVGAGNGKPVWVTETGWPVAGKTSGDAVANTANAQTYWDDVGCGLFGKTNTWWYTLVDANTDPTQPSFGIVGTTLSSVPLYDLSCDGVTPKSGSPTQVSDVLPITESQPLSSASTTSNPPVASAIPSPPSSNSPSPQASAETNSSSETSSSSSEDLNITRTLIDTPSTQTSGSTATSTGSSSESTGSGSSDSTGTGSNSAASGTSASSSSSASGSSKPNAAAILAPASVGGLVGALAVLLAIF